MSGLAWGLLGYAAGFGSGLWWMASVRRRRKWERMRERMRRSMCRRQTGVGDGWL